MKRLEELSRSRNRGGGLAARDAVLVAQPDERVGELRSLLKGVDVRGDADQRLDVPVGIVVGDAVEQVLQVGADQLGKRDEQRQVGRGEIEEPVPEIVERVVG